MEYLDVKINGERIKVKIWWLFYESDKQRHIRGEIRSWDGPMFNPLCGKPGRIAEITSDKTEGLNNGLCMRLSGFKIKEQKIVSPIMDPACIQFTAKAIKLVFGRPVFC